MNLRSRKEAQKALERPAFRIERMASGLGHSVDDEAAKRLYDLGYDFISREVSLGLIGLHETRAAINGNLPVPLSEIITLVMATPSPTANHTLTLPIRGIKPIRKQHGGSKIGVVIEDRGNVLASENAMYSRRIEVITGNGLAFAPFTPDITLVHSDNTDNFHKAVSLLERVIPQEVTLYPVTPLPLPDDLERMGA